MTLVKIKLNFIKLLSWITFFKSFIFKYNKIIFYENTQILLQEKHICNAVAAFNFLLCILFDLVVCNCVLKMGGLVSVDFGEWMKKSRKLW